MLDKRDELRQRMQGIDRRGVRIHMAADVSPGLAHHALHGGGKAMSDREIIRYDRDLFVAADGEFMEYEDYALEVEEKDAIIAGLADVCDNWQRRAEKAERSLSAANVAQRSAVAESAQMEAERDKLKARVTDLEEWLRAIPADVREQMKEMRKWLKAQLYCSNHHFNCLGCVGDHVGCDARTAEILKRTEWAER
jgi:hypothetical protein